MCLQTWSSLVEGDEGLYLPNCESDLVIPLDALSLLFCIYINTTAFISVSCCATQFKRCTLTFTDRIVLQQFLASFTDKKVVTIATSKKLP